MPFARTNLWSLVACLGACSMVAFPAAIQGAGVTVVTHGNTGDTDGWVTGMANALSDRLGGSVPIYKLQVNEAGTGLVSSISKVSGTAFLADGRGEVILLLDWRPPVADGNSFTTLQVATNVAPLFAQTNLIAELGGHALAELPLHLIGHSRGGSLMCELSQLLGHSGLWVDHLTGLDTHPLNNDGFSDFIYSITDPSAKTYENVLFAESYYQTAAFFADGLLVPGSSWRKLTEFSGGYSGIDSSHSDVHLWYHGSIDLNTPTTDGDFDGSNPVMLTSTMRDTWWTPFEQAGTNAGFVYSLLGGGDRLSTNLLSESNSSPVREGFNRYYNVGGGAGPTNRTAVGSNSGEWPNPIRFDLLSTNSVQQGDTATLEIYFQWAQPNTSTQSVEVLADPDRNPLNGNEILLQQGYASGTTVPPVGHGTIDVALSESVPPGDYQLFVKMSAAGRTRFLDAPQTITVTPGALPLVLDIAATTNSAVVLGINGVAGQTAILELSLDGSPWTPVATNTLSSTRWETLEAVDPEAILTLFRARLSNP